nr:hypothetical protein HmN_000145800 [Hymenolepis microstoma]
MGLLHFLLQSCPLSSLNSATASILGQSAMLESAAVYYLSSVRAFSSLLLGVFNSLMIKVFIRDSDLEDEDVEHKRTLDRAQEAFEIFITAIVGNHLIAFRTIRITASSITYLTLNIT